MVKPGLHGVTCVLVASTLYLAHQSRVNLKFSVLDALRRDRWDVYLYAEMETRCDIIGQIFGIEGGKASRACRKTNKVSQDYLHAL